VLGFTAGKIPSIALNLPLVKEAAIVGVFWNSWIARQPLQHHQNMAELYDLYQSGKLSPLIGAEFPLHDYEQAFASISARRARGKIILKM
jgi:NADPH2:quinone reductase